MSLWEHLAQGQQGLPRDCNLNYLGSIYPEWWEIMLRVVGWTDHFCQAVRDRGSKEIAQGKDVVKSFLKSTACYLWGQENYRDLINLLEQQELHRFFFFFSFK